MNENPTTSNSNLSLSSTAFKDGEPIPKQYTCKGENTNPPLSITGVPPSAQSLALIVHDPDAPSGDFVHWLMWDVPASTVGINANSVPVGAVQGSNGAAQPKYMGPCPPAGTGTHHYIFELYALDKTLGLGSGSDRDQLQKAMSEHIVADTKLTGLFSAD